MRLDGARNGDFRDREYPTHRELKTRVINWSRASELRDAISALLVYLMIVPFVLPEIFPSLHQAICFPLYLILKARRS